MTVEPQPPRRDRPGAAAARPKTAADAHRGHALVVALLALVIGAPLERTGLHKSAYNQQRGLEARRRARDHGAAADVEPRAPPRPAAQRLKAALGRSATTRSTRRSRSRPRHSPPVTTTRRSDHHRRPPGRPAGEAAQGRLQPETQAPALDRGRFARDLPGGHRPRAPARPGRSSGRRGRTASSRRVSNGRTCSTGSSTSTAAGAQARGRRPRLRRQRRPRLHDRAAEGRLDRRLRQLVVAREYARRVGGLMDIVNRAGAFVVWIGLPITRTPRRRSAST